MEIFKLGDEIPEKERGRANPKKNKNRLTNSFNYDIIKDKQEVGGRRVTELKPGAKNPNRVNVFLDGKFAFSLDIQQVVEMGVKVGLVIPEEELARYREASEFGKAYQRALEWVLMRPRSERELRDYLKRREMTKEAKEKERAWREERREKAEEEARAERPEFIEGVESRKEKISSSARRGRKTREKYDFKEIIIQRLKEKGYVDDRRFAEYYVENRFVKKGVSRRRLEMELIKKGVSREIREEVLGKRSDEEEIKKIIAKKRGKYNDEKLISYLCRQGFSFELARSLVLEKD